MKSKILIIAIILAVAFGAVGFYTTNSILCCLIIVAATILYFIFLFTNTYVNFNKKISRFRECYIFINNFIISLSIKSSLIGAFESVQTSISYELKHELNKIQDMKEIEKLNYLISYFKFDDYRLFVDIVSLWLEEGGNILTMSQHVTNHIREVQEYILFSESKSKSKFFEFALLWGFTIIIMIVLRAVLNDFLSGMLNNMMFKIGVVLVFVFLLVSLQLFLFKLVNLEIGGWKDGKY